MVKALKKVLAVLFVLAVLAPATVLAAEADKVNSGSKKGINTTSVTASNLTYNGSTQTSKVVVKDGDKVLVAGTDYTVSGNVNRNAGTYTVTITGMGNYTGTTTKTYKIAAKATTGVKVTAASKTYNGRKQTAKVVVKDGSKTLKLGTDYTLSKVTYRTGAGKTKIVVTFKGNYKGTKSVTFTVNKAKQKITVKGTTSVKAKAVKKRSRSYNLSVRGIKGKAKYTISYKSNSNKISVNKRTGKITVKKGAKKGSKVRIYIKTKATSNYKATTKVFVFTVK
ncbi:MAG: hypothetical protein J6L77_10190 [Coprococcus sp.]|nr:hypothetical protein [Coprococcus sp.]